MDLELVVGNLDRSHHICVQLMYTGCRTVSPHRISLCVSYVGQPTIKRRVDHDSMGLMAHGFMRSAGSLGSACEARTSPKSKVALTCMFYNHCDSSVSTLFGVVSLLLTT